MSIIIGLCGAAGSGKDETAKILAKLYQEKYPRRFGSSLGEIFHFAFAYSLKQIAKDVFGWDGQKDERGRRLLQVIGTECGRAYNPNIWIEKWNHLVDNVTRLENVLVLTPDVRFDNEAEAIHSKSGFIIKITGRKFNLGENSTHASEAGIDPKYIDFTIDNSGSLEDLERHTKDVFQHLIASQK